MKLRFDISGFKGDVHTIGCPNGLSFRLSTWGCKIMSKTKLVIELPVQLLCLYFAATNAIVIHSSIPAKHQSKKTKLVTHTNRMM